MGDVLVECSTFSRAWNYPLTVARLWGRRLSVNGLIGGLVGVAAAWLVSSLLVSHVMVWVAFIFGTGAMFHTIRLDGRTMGVSLAVWVVSYVRALPTALKDRLRCRRRVVPALRVLGGDAPEAVWL